MIKTLSKLEIKGNFPNLVRSIYKKPIANIIPDDKYLLSALNLSIQHFTGSPSQYSKTKNSINKDIKTYKELASICI